MLIYLILSCCLLFSQDQAGKTLSVKQIPLLYQHWIHSQEEDSAPATRTYRPATYAFPPARGRDGFEVKKNGIILSHPIAAADGNQTVPEKWKLSKGELIITGKSAVRRFTILSLTKEKLVLKPL